MRSRCNQSVSSNFRTPGWIFGPIACLGLLVSFALVGCRPQPALTPQEADGKHLYEVRCAHCHEDNDLALKKVPPNLHGVFKHAALPSGAVATDLEVKRVVLKGKGMMPGFDGRFAENELTDLLAYLHSDQH